jgi:hypothetical protein
VELYRRFPICFYGVDRAALPTLCLRTADGHQTSVPTVHVRKVCTTHVDTREILNSHSGVDEDSSVLGCDDMSTGK